jgi:hypothetical protein
LKIGQTPKNRKPLNRLRGFCFDYLVKSMALFYIYIGRFDRKFQLAGKIF